jgi:hypothetical protein
MDCIGACFAGWGAHSCNNSLPENENEDDNHSHRVGGASGGLVPPTDFKSAETRCPPVDQAAALRRVLPLTPAAGRHLKERGASGGNAARRAVGVPTSSRDPKKIGPVVAVPGGPGLVRPMLMTWPALCGVAGSGAVWPVYLPPPVRIWFPVSQRRIKRAFTNGQWWRGLEAFADTRGCALWSTRPLATTRAT